MKPFFTPGFVLALFIATATPTLASGERDSTHSGPGAGVTGSAVRHFDNISVPSAGREESDPIRTIYDNVSDSLQDRRSHAHALLEKVLQGQRFLESLDALSEIELPVGVVKSGGALDYSILIDRIEFSKEGAVMDVYVSLAMPQNGSRMAFHGRIPLSAEGGISGNAKVYLLGDHPIKVNRTSMITIKGTDMSYVEFDCSGFIGVNLDAELQFSTDLLAPEDDHGNIQPGRLRVPFTAYAHSLHDIIVTVSMPPFQLRSLPGFGFLVNGASIDWSDLANPPGMVFPPTYSSPVMEAGLPDLWQGIYLEEVEVRLPPAFTKKASSGRITVGASQMIIDDLGLTGALFAENVLREGDMSGWTYSLDKVSLQLFANEVSGFSLEGNLAIPVVKEGGGNQAQFHYLAGRSAEGGYMFSVAVEKELQLDLWVAELKLMKGSSVVVSEKQNRFYPSAHLNGELSINVSGKGPKTRFNSIRFEDMVINSEAPYFKPGTFGLGGDGHNSSVSKYPVVFDNITLKSQDTRVGLAFDIIINISGKPEDESFAGKAGLVVWGNQDDKPRRDDAGNIIGIERYSWEFDKVELTAVKINIKKPKIIELAGEVRFYDDNALYGEGFKGSLKGTIQTIKVEAEALFGKTESFRYWYADALVELNTGIPIVPGVLSAFGFGGGYYSRMKQSDQPVEGTLGRSPSGISYVPDENTIGIRAIVLIGTPRPQAMKGDVALEVSLNRHGGINSVTFTGNANFMSPTSLSAGQIKELAGAAVAGNLTEKLGSLKKGQVFGSVRLHFDNVNDVFHGNLEIYVNVAGGMVRGVSAGNKAGWAVLHFEKNDWYIHIGTPDQPLGLEVARIFKSKSYFMLGKNLPGSPPPPAQVSEILGGVNLDYMRDLNALESGMGIAFGLHFLVDTGDLRFLMFYGRFSAGTGLDLMLKDYGNDYHCAGASAPMGINGWYANGQAYAFVMGKIGVKVNLRFYKGTYDILSIGAAAILQAKGPNPFWMKGTVGGYYKILGGLVKGQCRFEVTVGKECKPVAHENLLDDVNMIAGVTPANGAQDVNVFNTPQLAFNIPVGKVFEITDTEGRTHSFRAVLEEFSVSQGLGKLSGKVQWNNEKYVAVFDADDLLPGESKLNVKATLTFEEKVNGVWVKVKSDGRIVSETVVTYFQTGAAPAVIPLDNVAYSYPVVNQTNFHPDEYGNGFLQLREGQPYLFKVPGGWIQKVRMTDVSTGNFFESDLVYDARTRQISFAFPRGFQNSKVYRFQIVNIAAAAPGFDDNIRNIETKLNIDESAGTALLSTKSSEGYVEKAGPRILFDATFRTSRYNTFVQKMRSVSLTPAIRMSAGINVFQLISYLKGDEFFAAEEIPSTPGANSLIKAEAVLDKNQWYEQTVYPLLYEGYPLLGWMKVSKRDPGLLGLPPIRDIYFENVHGGSTDANNQASPPGFSDESLVFNLAQSVTSDYFDLQRHAVNFAVDSPGDVTPRIGALITAPLPYVRQGAYRVRLSYHIPGLNKTTSSYEVEIFNPIPDND